MKRLIVPPLPAASRPSNERCTCASPVACPVLELQQLDLQEVFASSYSSRAIRSSYG